MLGHLVENQMLNFTTARVIFEIFLLTKLTHQKPIGISKFAKVLRICIICTYYENHDAHDAHVHIMKIMMFDIVGKIWG